MSGGWRKSASVKVTESFAIERFSHVMHISSNVEGKLRHGLDALDALVGGFPAGTLSGAPKVRAMEIIEELEPDRRGIYAGCIGYFAANGTMDTCIGLRTALVKDGTMYVQAGGGVVADSDPESEYEECRQKARRCCAPQKRRCDSPPASQAATTSVSSARRHHVAWRLPGRRGLGPRRRFARRTLQDHAAALEGAVRLRRERAVVDRDL